MQKRLFTILVATVLWQPVGAVDIELEGEVIGTLDTLRIDQSPDDPTRILAVLSATFPAFVRDIDQRMSLLGNMKDCGNRLYWVGGTSIEAAGSTLRLRSDVRYENWICMRRFLDFTTRTFRSTRPVFWTVEVSPAPIDQLIVTARIEDISGVSD